MRKTFVGVLMMALAIGAIPARLFAAVKADARQQVGSLSGVAEGADKVALPNYTVRVRNASSGLVAASTTSTQTGTFEFTGLLPGSYVVEIVDASGKIVGLSSSVAVGAGAAVSVTVSATTAGSIGAATGGGFSLMGLGPAASVAVIGAAGATTALVAIKATGDPASPSR